MVYRPVLPGERAKKNPSPPWKGAAAFRRLILFTLTFLSTACSSMSMYYVLTENHSTAWRGPMVGFFALLCLWISFNFWIALSGFIVLVSGKDRFNLNRSIPSGGVGRKSRVKTAIVTPIYNEDAAFVFTSLRATYRSLARIGRLDDFDFFVLSDTDDPDKWAQEEVAWAALCQELKDSRRICYRRRKNRIHKKSGNIADFCRRWGACYRYMIVLDADSILSGGLAGRMVEIMEHRPDVGILQSVPKPVLQKTLLARIQQFAGHVYGTVFMAGFHFWQLGDACFWGHNAIIRVEPFMKFCALPKFPGSPPFGGEILSHDFVEAALMRRAGFGVWLAYDLDGSYEQMPPHLLTELGRDRRWCRGNVQHLRLVGMKGISLGHRVLFLAGNFFYWSSFFWFLFLLSITFNLLGEHFKKPAYFPAEYSLYPHWPVYHGVLSSALLAMTVVFLMGPKLLGIFLLLYKGQAARFGGFLKILCGALLETVTSFLLAPIRMLFHSFFVLTSFLDRKFEWDIPCRNQPRISMPDAVRAFGLCTLIAIGWGVTVFSINRPFFGWFSIFLIPIGLSIPIAIVFSRADLGMAFRRLGLFVIPEEVSPPQELVDFQNLIEPFQRDLEKYGFSRMVRDQILNSLHCAFLWPPKKNILPRTERSRRYLEEKAMNGGLARLDRKEKLRLLSDVRMMTDLRRHYQQATVITADETASVARVP